MTRICVPVCVSHVSELPDAIRRASELADIIELRLDYLAENELNNSVYEIWKVLRASLRPIILTLRPCEQGGNRSMTVEDRLLFRVNFPPVGSGREDLWDVELDLALLLSQRQQEGNDVVAWGACDWDRTICSHHDFVGVPSDIEQIYAQMAQTKARILKLAVQADDVIDCLPIFRLLDQARREAREFIGIAMGPVGAITRIVGPSRGSYLTYGSLDHENSTAPGQLTAKELREVYRIDNINSQTEIFGIAGNPISQSLSPYIHNAAFATGGLNAVYVPFQTRDLNQFIRRMVRPKTRELEWNLRGLSVTLPHKSSVMSFLDWIGPTAKEIGAVNTIVVQNDRLLGYNTDAVGFIVPLRTRCGSLRNARCAVIGAGGGARAALWALRNEGSEVTVFARDPVKLSLLAQEFHVKIRQLANAELSDFDLAINATPLGMRGAFEEATPVTASQLRGVRLAYDLVYNPLETKFMREAREAGCDTLGGIEMLLAQAVEQFKLWTGIDPDSKVMRAEALHRLSE